MQLPKPPRRPAPAGDPPDDEDAPARGGYLFNAEGQTPPITLTEPVTRRSTRLPLSLPPARLEAGRCFLVGVPGGPGVEVVQVAAGEQPPDGPRLFRRGRFGTLSLDHPAGTAVTPVTVERVEDWERWRSQDA